LDSHLKKIHASPWQSLAATFSEPNHWLAFALIITLMIGAFTVVPFISPYLVYNVGLTEIQLKWVYVAGGAFTLIGAPIIGRLADHFGKLQTYRVIAPCSALLMLIISHMPRVHVLVAVATVGLLMVVNAGRMIAAMAMVTSSVRPAQRGGFMSANSSVQHLATGFGAYVGGLIITQAGETGPLEHFGAVGWIAALTTLASLYFAARVRVAEDHVESAAELSLAAAAEATTDVGEPLAPA
jgi:predicted MFS family arabinose efflux permease